MSVLVDGIEVDYSGLPECARDILERYVEHGCYPGSGYAAILANDLTAVFRVDAETRTALPQIVKWLHNHAPSQAHGSNHRVADWMKARREERGDSGIRKS